MSFDPKKHSKNQLANIALELLNKTYGYKLQISNINKNGLSPDLVEYDSNGVVRIIVEIKGANSINSSNAFTVGRDLIELQQAFKPQKLILLCFSKLDNEIRYEISSAIAKVTNKNYEILDIDWVNEKYYLAKSPKDGVPKGKEKKEEQKNIDDKIGKIVKEGRNFYAVGHFWDDDNKLDYFIHNGVWENVLDENIVQYGKEFKEIEEITNRVNIGDILFLKLASNEELKVYAIGYVTGNPKDGHKLFVHWYQFDNYIGLKGLGAYRNTITKVGDVNVDKILRGLMKVVSELVEIIEALVEKPSNDKADNIPSKIATFKNDGTNGEDYFEIDKDVTAFAKVIASASFKPPLAIALFGKWGMGKSFFMNKLHEKIEDFSKSETNNESPTYVKGIAQIHFNAWSYIDHNLFASLVAEIFEKLDEYLSGTTKSEIAKIKVQKKLTERLLSLRDLKLAVNNRLKEIKKAYEIEQTELNEKIKNELPNKLLKIINSNDEIKNLYKNIGEINSLITEVIDINDSKVIKKTRFFKDIFSKWSIRKVGIKKYFYIILFGLVIIIIEYFTGLLSNISFFNIGLIPLIKSVFDGFTFTKLNEFVTEFNKIITTDSNVKKEISEIEKSLKQNKKEIVEVEQQINNLDSEINEYEYKMGDLLTETFYDFIDSRANSNEYKKYTGIISVIRKDFETLSGLFAENSKENSKEQIKEDREYIDKQFKDNKKLKRIVLYIDDLDRCPEAKVIEVLEAVNLIMAFPLFVVVVGVDQRWVKNALIKKYHLQFGNLEVDNTEYVQIEASDYLEKIFQVPFHLKQADDSGVKTMIEKLTVVNEESDDAEVDKKSGIKEKADVKETDIKIDNNTNIAFEENNNEKAENNENNEHLALNKREVELMQEMSGIIGNNPRTIKRFINVYNIVRAHEGLGSIRKNKDEDYLVLMFLLALPMGPFKELYSRFINRFIDKNDLLSKPIYGNSHPILLKDSESRFLKTKEEKLNEYIDNNSSLRVINSIDAEIFAEKNKFIQRFTFTDIK